MIGMICAGGEICSKELFYFIYNKADIKIAADSGINIYNKFNTNPDMILGDLDSINTEVLMKFKEISIPIKKFPAEKNQSDFELCIDYLVEKGCNEIFCLGGIGSRMDHTLANILILSKYISKDIKCYIIDDNNKISIHGKTFEVVNDYENISILAPFDSGALITLENFYYNLNNEWLVPSLSRGISNYLVEPKGRVIIHEGKVLLIESND